MTAYLEITLILLSISGLYGQNTINNYVGRGYDLFHGNPKSKTRSDPGFRQPIFQLSYSQNRMSADGYRVPDNIDYAEFNSFIFNFYQNEYTGMQEYQKQLKTSANFDYNGIFAKASFTSNTEFNEVKKNTENHVVIEANAKSERYTLSMNLFNMLPITATFQKAVLDLYHNLADWNQFFQVYGTHFIYKTIVGGRASYQYKLSTRDYQELRHLNVDVKLAASYKMASFSTQVTYDEKKVEAFQKRVTEINKIWMGGEPQAEDDFIKWSESVRTNPVPIYYELKDLSFLFTSANFPTLDYNQLQILREIYYSRVENYCRNNACYEVGYDKPLPPSFVITESKETHYAGGKGGYWFADTIPKNTLMRVKRVICRAGRYLDGIQFELSDGVNTMLTPWRGGLGGGYREFVVPDDQYISQIEMYSGKYVDSITFITNKGVRSERFGDSGGYYTLFNVGPYLVGMYGKAAAWVDGLGFYSNDVIY